MAIDTFCWCGLPAVKKINNIPLCHKHDAPKDKRQKIKRYSGKSNSEFAHNEY